MENEKLKFNSIGFVGWFVVKAFVRFEPNLSIIFFSDLTPEQQKLLIEIRKKKQELLLEIQVSL